MDNRISFQGQTQLMFNSNMYNKLQHKTQDVSKHISTEVTRRVPKFSTYTAEVPLNNVIVYMGDEKSGILRTIPLFDMDLEPAENITLANLTRLADELAKKAKEKLTVWIIGGDSAKGLYGNESIKTVNEIAEVLCDRPDVDGSILACSNAVTNKVVFHQAGGKLNVTIGNDYNPKEISENELLNHFDIVELNNVIAG